MRPATELATRISRALITASTKSIPTRTWTPSVEHTLHQLGCRNSLSPSLVARVIDPFLLTHHSLALGFFNWASQQPGFSHSSISYQSILKSLSHSRQFNAIDLLLKQAKTHKLTLTISIYRDVIGSYIKCRKTHNAYLLFNDVLLQINELGPDTCNSLLAALGADGYFDNGKKMFDEMCDRGVCLSTIGFGVFVWRFCRIGEVGKVLSMIDIVKARGFDVNGSVIAVLVVQGLCEGSRVKEAMWALDELRNRGWKPDFIAYRIVAEALLDLGNVVDREIVLKKKRKLGVAPRSNDYREFILDMIAERRIKEANDLGGVIIDGNFPIEDDVLNLLIGSVSSIDPVSAIRFLNFMAERGKFPTLLTLSNLSRNLCKHEKYEDLLEVYRHFEDAERLFHHMLDRGVAPDATCYSSLIEGLCLEENFEAASERYAQLFLMQFATIMIKLIAFGVFRRFVAASELLCSLTFDIGHSDCHTTLLKCSADAGEQHIAIKHIKWISETSPSMLHVIANGISGSLSSSSKPDQILQLLQEIQNCQPDSSVDDR
ncbi:hypothetical protein ACFE04_010599 [Oxalis oulophora]